MERYNKKKKRRLDAEEGWLLLFKKELSSGIDKGPLTLDLKQVGHVGKALGR